ncbi:MAG TPA: hypothetical protein VM012_00460 [Flavitalea sp.]|nr:hypothetical protein [Flavitalea sp.]
MKYSQWIGIVAIILLIVSCFLPWTWYPDLQKHFNGFFSENNTYGRPGRVFIFLAIPALIFFLIPKIWAKRWNIFVGAILFAYAIKTYILFSACYTGICPEKKPGLWMMISAAALTLVMTIIPDQQHFKKDTTPSSNTG